MKEGQLFYLYQEGKQTRLVLAINNTDVMCLDGCKGEIIKNIDFDNEVVEILIDNIYEL